MAAIIVKAKVLSDCTDKVTGKDYKKGDVIELTAQRFNEINAKSNKFIKLVEDDGTVAPKKENK
jgi:hypothetical protein